MTDTRLRIKLSKRLFRLLGPPIGLVLVVQFLGRNHLNMEKLAKYWPQQSSCHRDIKKLQKDLPDSWGVNCDKSGLTLSVAYQEESLIQGQQLFTAMYQNLARQFLFMANHTDPAQLLRLPVVRLNLSSPDMTLQGAMPGRELMKMGLLPNPDSIQKHWDQFAKVRVIR